MRSVVICEKPSQAENVRAAVGDEFGRVLAAQGHLLRLEEPEEVNEAWKRWNNDVLAPPAGRYGYKPYEGSGKPARLAEIKSAIAGADQVIIATDCDREGQAIGESLVRHLGFKGKVLRAMFTAEDAASLRAAFSSARPNEIYRPLFESAVARQQADQIFNLTLTRVASNVLRPAGWKQAIGVGRVKTPTLGIVCRREIEIREFKSRAFIEIGATVVGEKGSVEFWHRPKGEGRVLDKGLAAKIEAVAKEFNGPLTVTWERKRAAPPRPLDLPGLQKAAGKWGWSARKTLDVLQALYETHKLTTYPRAETRYLPEALEGQAPKLLEALRASHAAVAPAEAVIRKSVYSDKGLNGASHHAVIPNVNVADRFAALIGALNEDEVKLFDLVARAWLAAVSPDNEFDETVMSFRVFVENNTYEFSVSGRVELAVGWRGVFRDEDEDRDELSVALPVLANGEIVSVGAARVVEKSTTPPGRYSEGELVDAMKNAWRFLPDGPDRERLKEAKGIGTPATRDAVIEGLKGQKLLEVQKGKLVPTEVGLWVFGLLAQAASELLDPAATARMESRLDAVLEGGASIDSVLSEIVDKTKALVASILAAGATVERLAVKRAPTSKMIEAARAKANRDGLKRLPKGVADDFDVWRAFLGPMSEKGEGPALATEKQIGLITRLVGKGHSPPEGYPGPVTLASASAWIGEALNAQTKA